MLPQQIIDIVLLDVDGVLTDGSLPYVGDVQSGKTFFAQDGAMIKRAQQCGLVIGIISGRASSAVAQRAQELGIRHCCLGVHDKVQELQRLCDENNWDVQRTLYLGDDIPDLEICQAVGFSVAVADASPLLRRVVDHVTQAAGGRGAVAELLVALLRHQGQFQHHQNNTADGGHG